MKITIDTQADTYEDIKKVLYILTDILQKKGESLNSSLGGLPGSSFAESKPVDSATMMGMFGDEQPTNAMNPANSIAGSASPAVPDTPPDFSSFLNLAKDAQKKVPGAKSMIEVY